MIVKDFKLGNTHIMINDDAIVKTKAEVETILRRCGEIVAQSETRIRDAEPTES